jgi:hypothetical protein
MSKNQKSINIFKTFFEERMGADRYLINDYSLSSNYPLSMMVSVDIGGSSGGNCWGDYSTQYDNSNSYIADCIARDIQYNLRNIAQFFHLDEEKIKSISVEQSKSISFNAVATNTSSGDYYGNYTNYALFAVDVLNILKQVMTHQDYEVLQGFASNVKMLKDHEFKSSTLVKEEEEIVNKIESFSNTKKDELLKIKKSIEDTQKRLAFLQESLTNFEKTKLKEYSNLTELLKSIRTQINAHNDPQATKSTKITKLKQ